MMTVPDLPAVHHITVDGEDYLATYEEGWWDRVGGNGTWEGGVTDHSVVIPAGPVESLVQLPEVGEAVRRSSGWCVDGGTNFGSEATEDAVRKSAANGLRYAAQCLAVARAIEAEQAKPTARERLLARLHERQGDGHEYLEWPVGDLLDALGEQ